jgi:hypothetical protein
MVSLHDAPPSPRELLVALVHGLSLPVVVPVTLAIVESNPLATAGCFDGDLLRGLMEVRGEFWAAQPQFYERYRAVVRRCAWLRRDLPAERRMEFWSRLPCELEQAAIPPRNLTHVTGDGL